MAPLVQEANKKHSVNGFIFCNMPEASVPQDSHVRFVLIGVGGETDMHTPGFTNHLQQTAEGSGYVVELFPGAARISNLLAGQTSSGLCLHTSDARLPPAALMQQRAHLPD